jgi:peptidylprolyl isomerase
MAKVQQGDSVKVNYTGRLEDGTIFDSSECAEDGCGCPSGPLTFTVGAGEVIPGFDSALPGMTPGEKKTVTIPVNQAYGERMEEMIAVIPRSDLPEGLAPEVGQQLEVTQEDGAVFPVLITEITDSQVTLDANHPLAGRTLIFDIELLEIAGNLC